MRKSVHNEIRLQQDLVSCPARARLVRGWGLGTRLNKQDLGMSTWSVSVTMETYGVIPHAKHVNQVCRSCECGLPMWCILCVCVCAGLYADFGMGGFLVPVDRP